MTVLAVIVGVIVVLLLLRVGADAEFSDGGLSVTAKVAFLRFRVFPQKGKLPKSEKKRKECRKPRKSGKPDAAGEKKPGGATDFRKLISGSLKLLRSLKRKIYIKKLYIHYIQGGGDPFSMAMAHGTFSAVFGVTQAVLESQFRVRDYSLYSSVDYVADSPKIYARAEITMAVGQVISLGFSAILLFIRAKKPVERGSVSSKSNEKTAETAGKGEA